MNLLDKLKYKQQRDDGMPGLQKGSDNYSYSGDGIDYRDWDPNITGKFTGNGVDAAYSVGNFTANRGDLGAGYTKIDSGMDFNARAVLTATVEQDILYALLGSVIQQYIQNSLLIWLLSVVGFLVWLIAMVLAVQLAFKQTTIIPQAVRSMSVWQQIEKIKIQWWLILSIVLTSIVGLNFPSGQNFLMMMSGVVILIWFITTWANKNWILLAIGITLLFSGFIRQYIDYSANTFVTNLMRWPSLLCCGLLLIDVLYLSKK